MIAMIDLKTKMIEYFEQECEWASQGMIRKHNSTWEVVQNAKMRLYGVAIFCQTLGIEENYVEEHYNFYVEKLEKLLTN